MTEAERGGVAAGRARGCVRRSVAGLGRAALAGVLAACGGADGRGGAAGDWQARVDTLGDTIVVRTERGSAWGDRARLVEEVRIGELDGPAHYTFGRIRSVVPSADGRLYVLDEQVPAVRVFDAAGAHILSFGRRGSGPGEMQRPDAMALMPDGRVLVRDPGNARISVFTPEGESLESWRIDGTFSTSDPMYVAADGRVFTQAIISERMAERMEVGLVTLQDGGTPGDTLRAPVWNYEPPLLTATNESDGGRAISRTGVPFTPQTSWTLDSHGRVVGGLGTRYAVEAFRTDGRILRIERTTPAVPVQPGEREFREHQTTRNMRNTDPNWRWSGPSIPGTKPPISRVRVDHDDRIWVQVAAPGEVVPEAERPDPPASGDVGPTPWRDPLVFDLFEGEGRFLATLHAPPRFTWTASRGDHVWGVTRDELDVQYVVRLRIER
jgi:hypothetical protein